MTLNRDEIAYLESQPLGRLATVDANGMPQNNPVGVSYNHRTGTIDITGRRLGSSRKFANVAATGKVSLVIDDIVSTQPWEVRMLEIRGTAEALRDQPQANSYFSPEIIRVHPRRVVSFGVVTGSDGLTARTVRADLAAEADAVG